MLWISFALFAIYVIGETALTAVDTEGVGGKTMKARRNVGGFLGGGLIAAGIAIAAANTNSTMTLDDVTWTGGTLGGATNSIETQQAAWNATHPTKPLYDLDCADVRMSPSFGDFGISGTRLGNTFFFLGLMISSVCMVMLEGTDEPDEANETYTKYRRLVSAFVCVVMTALGSTIVLLNLLRLPEHTNLISGDRTRGHGISSTRANLLNLLAIFLILTLVHDLFSKYGRGFVSKSTDGVQLLPTIVEYLSIFATIAAIVGTSMMIANIDENAAIHRYNQVAGVSDGRAQIGPAPPAATVCVEDQFDDYKTAVCTMTTLVAVALLYVWRCFYAAYYNPIGKAY